MNDSKRRGWVRLHRKIDENPLWFLEPFTKAQAWVDLFLNANHKDGIINIRGNIIKIKRGQIGWSELTMAKRWSWSKNKVRRFLFWLKTEQQIEQQKSPLTTIITIVKYDEHQQDDTTDDTTERQQKDNRRYTNKNDKECIRMKRMKKNILSEQSSQEISKFIKLFETVNPSYEKFYGNKTQRAAVARLLKKYGFDKAAGMVKYLNIINNDQYSKGKSITPLQLEDNLALIIAHYNQQKNNKPKVAKIS